jgi:hypothetical protein
VPGGEVDGEVARRKVRGRGGVRNCAAQSRCQL